MDTITYNTALIVGAGVGLSAALTGDFSHSKASALRWQLVGLDKLLPRFAKKPVP